MGCFADSKKGRPAKADKKPLSKQGQFVAKYAASAAALEAEDGIPALFTLGQGALESGWGEKAIGNALFGIKPVQVRKKQSSWVTTTEYFKDDKQGHRFLRSASPPRSKAENINTRSRIGSVTMKRWKPGLADHSRF
ncbi:MAG: glucosaminidase domain-containing protein [Bacteroidetes bacterium]|nr:glucosaminidase domain-containing protein [Bacteroidota bacterium]